MSRPRSLNRKPEGATLTPSEIKRAWDALSKKRSKLGQAFIDAGRGYERPTDYASKTDPLSVAMNKVHDQFSALESEARRYAGPGWQQVIRWGSKW